jgi:lipoate-protein ligase A
MGNLTIRIVPFSTHSAIENMAIDEAIFRLYKKIKKDTIRFYGWNPSTVSIGKHQNVHDEVNLKKIEEYGFDCIRRISGGGSVFHDQMGELTYSIVTNKQNLSSSSLEESYYELSKIVFHPLEKLGLRMEFDKIHCPSIFSDGKKISGNAQARAGDIILQHGTLLINFHPETMYSVLKARPGRDTDSMVKSVYQHVTTLTEKLNDGLNPKKVAHYLQKELILSGRVKYEIGKLTEDEKNMVQELIKTKFQSNEWVLSG